MYIFAVLLLFACAPLIAGSPPEDELKCINDLGNLQGTLDENLKGDKSDCKNKPSLRDRRKQKHLEKNIKPITCDKKGDVKLFESDEPLEMTVKSDLFKPEIMNRPVNNGYGLGNGQAYDSNFDPNTKEERKYTATMIYKESRAEVTIPLELETRGAYRSSLCPFKPLKFDFKKKSVDKTLFAGGDDEFKYVTHCYDVSDKTKLDEANQKVLAEYQLYKTLNILGLPSFKARLTKTKYQDENGKLLYETYGFFIEPKKDLARRCESDAVKKEKTEIEESPRAFNMIPFILSEKLLRNYDYNSKNGHNSVLLKKDGKPNIVVPYDFDLSSLTNSDGEPDYGEEAFFDSVYSYRILDYNTMLGKDIPNETIHANLSVYLKKILKNKEKALESLEKSALDDTRKKFIKSNFEVFFKAAEEEINRKTYPELDKSIN